MPRIIAGSAGGITLDTLRGQKTRPTSDRAKEALFNILQGRFSGGNILDLFAGSGSLGLEAVSRGAGHCLFIDHNPKSIEILIKNIDKCRVSDKTEVICMDVMKAISAGKPGKRKYKCIFMDPPYGKNLLISTIEKISETDIMEKDSILVVEHGKGETPPKDMNGFSLLDRRNYGAVNFSFYNRRVI